MASSDRLQITLNPNKTNEKLIIQYLSTKFDDKTAVKEILYYYITQIEHFEQSEQNYSKILKVSKIEQIEEINSNRVEDDNLQFDLNMVENIEVVEEAKNPNDEIRINELDQLYKFK